METSGSIPPALIRAGAAIVNEWTAGEFRSRLRTAPGQGTGPVIVDLTGVQAMDWTTLGEIAGANRRCQESGRGFGVVCPAGRVRDMFWTAGADKVMDIVGSADELACWRRELPRRAGGSRPADGPGRTVSARVKAVLKHEPGDSIPLIAGLLYDKSDPYAVKVSFPETDVSEPAEWVFARDLLLQGLKGPAGSGGVRICPMPRGLLGIVLISPHGQARFDFDAREVDDFVTASCRLVPEGCERGAVANAIEDLFLPGGMFWEGRHA